MSKIQVRGAYLRSALMSRLGKSKPIDPSRFRPFVYRNRQRLEDARETAACTFCGYKGTALAFVPPAGEQGPCQLVYAGEKPFTRALERCTPTCCNCIQERRAGQPLKTKATLTSKASRTLEVLQKLEAAGEPVHQAVVTEQLQPVVKNQLHGDQQKLFSEVHMAVSSLASGLSDVVPQGLRDPEAHDAQ